jgi:hypothetical protein
MIPTLIFLCLLANVFFMAACQLSAKADAPSRYIGYKPSPVQ